MTRQEFQMALQELILSARPDLDLSSVNYSIETLEEQLYGKRGRDDEPEKSAGEGYAGWAAGKEL